MKEYEQKIHNIINNAEEDVIFQAHQAYEQGYATGYDHGKRDGYEDGKAATPFTDTEEAEKKAYNIGLNDAWNVAKKVNEIDADVYDKLFPMALTEGFYESYTAKEVIEKLAEYEDKQKQDAEIKVGDEVEFDINLDNNNKGIVTRIIDTRINKKGVVNAYVLWNDGSCGLHSGTVLKKTGHTHTQIAEVLAELRGAENDE